MKNRELFDKTVNILVKAYLNNTLESGNCKACAVGNIIAANCGIKNIFDYKEWKEKALGTPIYGWSIVFSTVYGEQNIEIKFYESHKVAKFQIDSSGYSLKELAKIEFAFEKHNIKGTYWGCMNLEEQEEYMYTGLMSVIDVLCEIHEINEEIKKETKELFVK